MKHPGGRPKIPIDWDKIERMASIHCTQEEICFVSGISVDTLDRACKREHSVSFADYCESKKAFGKMSLRRAMWKKAIEGGDNTMMIWLSKQHLGMTDKVENKIQQTQVERVFVADWGGKSEEPDKADG